MKLKVITGIVLTLFLASMLTMAFNIKPVKASGTIYIRADGSIDGPANITTVDYVTYYFNESNYDEIVVERDNIVVDGAGYSVQGTGEGMTLEGRSNVTIKNTNINAFYQGIRLVHSSNNSIYGNNITNGVVGIYLWYSLNNSLSGNNINKQRDGIHLTTSSNNSMLGNNIANNVAGIILGGSSNNNISANNITANEGCGIELIESSYNKFYHNNLNNTVQVYVQTSGYTNFWDDGYPSGGNYWSDYNGTDLYSGPYQNETGSDGIGDTPYIIDANNRDRYPLMKAWSGIEAGKLFGIAYIDGVNKLVTVNPLTGELTALSNFPSITGISQGVSALDATKHQYFFIGYDDQTLHGRLVTINTRTGVVVANPTLSYSFSCIEFDSATSTLFGVAWISGVNTLVIINPIAGELTPVKDFPSFVGVPQGCSAFDTTNHQYIFPMADRLFVVDVQMGTVVANPTIIHSLSSLEFDHVTKSLFGIAWISGANTLVIIDPITGEMTPLSSFPDFIGVVQGVSALDTEKHGYIFLMAERLFVVNTLTGTVIANTFFPYSMSSLEFESTPPAGITATIDIDPDTLNLKSKGEWITAYIELPEGYNVNDINVSTILLNNTIPAEWSDIQGDVLMVKFNRSEVISLLNVGNQTIKITGQLIDGTPFEGTDIIRAIHAQITLTDLHTIHLDVEGAFLKGENLKVKFYSYSGEYQGENTVWSGTTPAQILLSTNLPTSSPIENAVFILTDNEENLILNLVNFFVYRSDLFGRVAQIDVQWAYALPTERAQYFSEIIEIDMQWPYAPP